MNRIFFFIASFSFASILNCQIPFAPLGAKWYIQFDAECLPSSTDYVGIIEVSSDTIIFGKYCTKVFSNIGPYCTNVSYQYIHQDSNKVFVFDPETEIFYQLYNFNAGAGDSWKTKVCPSIFGTDTMQINVLFSDETRQFVEIMDVETGGSTYYEPSVTIFKGIGRDDDNTLLFKNIWLTNTEVCHPKLLCYYTPETNIIHINSETCEFTSVNEPDKINQQKIKLFPNPTSDISNILLPEKLSKEATWCIFDPLGRVVKRVIFLVGQEQAEVNLIGLPLGIYFWNLQSESRQIGSGKLVLVKQ